MGRNDYKNTVINGLREFLGGEQSSQIGSLKFTKADKRTSGKLFFKGGNVYAIEVSGYSVGLTRRVLQSNVLDAEYAEQISGKFNPANDEPLIVDYLLEYQLLSEKQLTTFVKDSFLGSWDDLSEWENVAVEWQSGDESVAFTVPFVNPNKLIDLAANRRDRLAEIASILKLNREQIGDLKYRMIADVTPIDINVYNLITVGTGEYTVNDAAVRYGLSPFIVKQILFTLWEEENVEFIYDNQFPIRYVDPNAVPEPVEMSESFMQEYVEAEIPPIPNYDEDGSLEVEPLLIEEEIPADLQDALPVVDAENSKPTMMTRPTPPIVYSQPAPPASQNEVEPTDYENGIDVEPVEDEVEVEVEPVQSVEEKVETVETASTAPSLPSNSKVPLIIQQLADELEKLRAVINESKERIDAQDGIISSTTQTINEKRALLDATREERAKEIDKLNEVTAQYNETVEYVRKIG